MHSHLIPWLRHRVVNEAGFYKSVELTRYVAHLTVVIPDWERHLYMKNEVIHGTTSHP